MKHHLDISFKIKTFWTGILIIIILGFLLFSLLTNYKEDYSIDIYHVLVYLTSSVAIFTLLYHSATLENRMEYQKKTFDLSKNKYSYDICAEWHNPLMQESIEKTRNLILSNKILLDDESKVSNFVDLITEGKSKDDRRHLILILNYFEHIAVMLKREHIDEKIIKSTFGTLFKSYYKALRFYIDYRQKEHSRSWQYFEETSKKWLKEEKME